MTKSSKEILDALAKSKSIFESKFKSSKSFNYKTDNKSFIDLNSLITPDSLNLFLGIGSILEETMTALEESNKIIFSLQSTIGGIESSNNKILNDYPLNVKETAKFLDLSVHTIYSKVSRGEIPYRKKGFLL